MGPDVLFVGIVGFRAVEILEGMENNKKQTKKEILKEKVLGLLYQHTSGQNGIGVEETPSLTGIGTSKVKNILYSLSTDGMPIGLTDPLYRFYIKRRG